MASNSTGAMHTFNVAEWVENDHPDFVPLVQPRSVGCWTKESITKGGNYNYGSTEGVEVETRKSLFEAHA